MEEKSVCPICGAPSNMYYGIPRKDKLCKVHVQELKEGKIDTEYYSTSLIFQREYSAEYSSWNIIPPKLANSCFTNS